MEAPEAKNRPEPADCAGETGEEAVEGGGRESGKERSERGSPGVVRHVVNGVKGAILGVAVGGSFAGMVGAAVGAGAFGLYGLVTGEVPFDPEESLPEEKAGRRGTGRALEEAGPQQRMVEDEIEQELKRQEERLRELDRRDLEKATPGGREREVQIHVDPDVAPEEP